MKKLLPLLGFALLLGSCFQPWPLNGPYACTDGACADGYVCDDGLCCKPGSSPSCPTLPFNGEQCPGGKTAVRYYEDKDGDGFGNPKAFKALCGRPLKEVMVADALDCDDTSAATNPNGTELCDGRDNDCDGVTDDGFALQTFYLDQDGDQFGAADAGLQACQQPPGYVSNNSDCAPSDPAKNPAAVERCNGVDDNCVGGIDEFATDGGQSCSNAGLGLCAMGAQQCTGGMVVCRPKNMPSPEACNGLDEDCNGVADNAPGCGGPGSLVSSDAGVVFRTRRHTGTLSQAQLTQACPFNLMDGGSEGWLNPQWTGAGNSDHVLRIEPSSGVWDLTRPNGRLRLDLSWTMIGAAMPAWSQSSQPVIYVCSKDGKFNRYVHAAPGGGGCPSDGGNCAGTLLTAANGSFSQTIPLAGSTDWVIGLGSSADLTQVDRIEIIVRPSYNAPAPSFTFTVGANSGFPP